MGLFPVWVVCVKRTRKNAAIMSLISPDNFQHILRVMNTNLEGKRNTMFAITAIKGVGRRFANIALKKADIDMSKRAGELSEEEVERIITIISNPRQYKIPDYFLNRQKDIKDGKTTQVLSNFLDNKLREDLERLRRSVPTVVSVTTGVSVSAVSIPRPPAGGDAPSVSQRRSNLLVLITIDLCFSFL